jgi:glutaredoxin
MQTQVLGLSVDSVPCLKAWGDSFGGITYPLLSDFYPHGKVAEMFGVLRTEGYTERAIFVIDKQGVIRYVDVHDIGEQPSNDDLFRVLADVDPEAVASQPPADTDKPSGDVVIYCTPWCSDCRKAREYFAQQNIAYTEVNINRNRSAAQQVREWADGKEVTPTLNIRGQIVVGFDRAKLEALL